MKITSEDKKQINDACNERTDYKHNFSFYWEDGRIYMADMLPSKYETAIALRNLIRNIGDKFKNVRVRISLKFK